MGKFYNGFNNINILKTNLYLFYSESDPNQHILDTLEQCISVIIEKLHRLDQDKNGSRLSSMEYSEPVKGKVIFFKIVLFQQINFKVLIRNFMQLLKSKFRARFLIEKKGGHFQAQMS